MKAWCEEHRKADGSAYNIYRDGLKIYTTIDSRMQRYAEEAIREHLTELQKLFYAHWKGREPWGSLPKSWSRHDRSDRYMRFKADGKSKRRLKRIFNTKVR